MPGLVPGIHVFQSGGSVGSKDVDGRDEPDHDGAMSPPCPLAPLTLAFPSTSPFGNPS